MAFDECTPYPCKYDYAANSMRMTHRWLDRCFDQMDKTEPKYGNEQSLFPIVQGSVYPELRKQSAEYIASKTAVGYAIGGLSVGEPHEDMYAMTDFGLRYFTQRQTTLLNGCWHPGQHIRMY